jgi:hypothetical protein
MNKKRQTGYLKIAAIASEIPLGNRVKPREYNNFAKGIYDKNITVSQANALQRAIVAKCEAIINETNTYVELIKTNAK